MISLDTKRMIYSFYVNDDSFEHPINKLHFKLLERYIHKFDEVIFCIIIDDRERYDLIQRIEEFVVSIFHKKLTFKIYDNTNYRESLVFYNEIVKQMSHLDGLTFFGHNKGVSDDDIEIEKVEEWVSALYFFNLEYELPNNDLNSGFFYGALKSADINGGIVRDTLIPKNRWYYCGTFFWCKYQELYEYCNKNSIDFPLFTNRWYDEMFPGNLLGQERGVTYGNFYILRCACLGDNIDEFLRETYGAAPYIYDEFITFYKKIIRE